MNTSHFQLMSLALGLFGTADAYAQVTKPVVSGTATQIVANTTTAVGVGQTINLFSAAYQVTAKKQLAPGVEYYTAKTIATKGNQNFLRTHASYERTMFTQAQYESFISTGKLSSFGTLKQETVDGTKVWSVTKGTQKALFATSPDNSVSIVEAEGSVLAAPRPPDTGGGAGCLPIFCFCCKDERRDCKEGPVQSPDEDYCDKEYEKCRQSKCNRSLVAGSYSLHEIKLSRQILTK